MTSRQDGRQHRSPMTWSALLSMANQERPHTYIVWETHRAFFQSWLRCSLREQAEQIREFVGSPSEGTFQPGPEAFEDLIPAGEPEMCKALFVSDLKSLFRVLAPVPAMRETYYRPARHDWFAPARRFGFLHNFI